MNSTDEFAVTLTGDSDVKELIDSFIGGSKVLEEEITRAIVPSTDDFDIDHFVNESRRLSAEAGDDDESLSDHCPVCGKAIDVHDEMELNTCILEQERNEVRGGGTLASRELGGEEDTIFEFSDAELEVCPQCSGSLDDHSEAQLDECIEKQDAMEKIS